MEKSSLSLPESGGLMLQLEASLHDHYATSILRDIMLHLSSGNKNNFYPRVFHLLPTGPERDQKTGACPMAEKMPSTTFSPQAYHELVIGYFITFCLFSKINLQKGHQGGSVS